jgi:hypothetical protein
MAYLERMRKISAVSAALFIVAGASVGHGQTSRNVTMYKQVGCGCCSIWAQYLQKAGFKVSSLEIADMDRIKAAHGVPRAVQTCHTATIDGYVVEGHVPLDAIEKLLKERPKIAGIGVAGMPLGSPGMEMGSRKDAYDVLAFDRDGKTTVYVKK